MDSFRKPVLVTVSSMSSVSDMPNVITPVAAQLGNETCAEGIGPDEKAATIASSLAMIMK